MFLSVCRWYIYILNIIIYIYISISQKSLKIPKGKSEFVNRRRIDNTINGQTKKNKRTNNDLQNIKLKIGYHELH